MKKRKRLKTWVENLIAITAGIILSICFLAMLIGAVLQYSYRLNPVTPEEVIINE